MSPESDHDANLLRPRSLLRGQITYSTAREDGNNILHQLGYRDERDQYFTHLFQNRQLIKKIIGRRLGLSSDSCHLVDVEDWIHGSFNVCIRADIDTFKPGNSDEKIRCEAGTYAWLQENCPNVPIPHLYGFGLSNGETFTHLEHMTFLTRIVQYLRRHVLRWLGYSIPTSYIPYQMNEAKPLGNEYILIEYIDSSRGQMLLQSWGKGSGNLTLSNRLLTLQLQLLENEHIPVDIPRQITHATADSYIHDLLAFHESRFRHQPNAVSSLQDGFYQACALSVIRSVWPFFSRRDLLRGPFFMELTDLHPSNIMVDEDWNIKSLIDLEWACSRPVEMIHPPDWLAGEPGPEMDLEAYEITHGEFVEILREEEEKNSLAQQPVVQLHSIMKDGWGRGTFWCSIALNMPMALFEIFYTHIQPRFSKSHKDDESFWLITMPYWTFGTFKFLEKKLRDKEQYDQRLHEAFFDRKTECL
ncbi:uncharacterized protein N7483_011657 [Penicillium malachiteum]|uniref:uncharacterized protein n=1 Tax=Penicillium malachiteum TaxID=1324776 RepID=UPI0025470532|nr:uncharacterized protein N7483_011657 [Penicillium malachiteum]KAJ5714476.1 hypothetical protein N7483_011657 [Penicillium malachiteum]